jgi:predicted acylesterase/phospholipase RssA
MASPVEYHPLATDAATGESTDLRPLIADEVELRLALRASASLPFLAGPPIELRDRRFYDAGVAESIPFRTPLAQGATHILVLRSRRPLELAPGPAGETGPAGAPGQSGQEAEPEARAEVAAQAEAAAEAQVEADDEAAAEAQAEAAETDPEAAAALEEAGSPLAPARPTRSVRLLTRTTLRNESPELRTAMLTRAARNVGVAEDIAERQAAGRALAVYPPTWTPQVSRLTTEGALLTAALVAGRDAVNVLFDEPGNDA